MVGVELSIIEKLNFLGDVKVVLLLFEGPSLWDESSGDIIGVVVTIWWDC